MKIILFVVFFFIFTLSYPVEKADTLRPELKAEAVISLHSNGISSIPYFALGKPAIISAVSLTRGRFSYDPKLAYALDFKPWLVDNWLRYKFIARTNFEFRAGINFSTFYKDYQAPEEEILQAQKYLGIELATRYRLSAKNSLSLVYWNDRGRESGTISGHFIDFIAERTGMKVGENLAISANIQLFYINYDGNNDGLFVSPKVIASVKHSPFSVFFQANQALISNISPFPEFEFDAGLNYYFR
jgi:hypothetical protein